MKHYPALLNHPNAKAYRRLMEYVLFSQKLDSKASPEFWSEEEDEEPLGKVLPYEVVAQLVEKSVKSKGFSAEAWIAEFSRNVFPLHCSESRYTEGKARVIRPQIHPDVLSARDAGLARSEHGGKVWFDTGRPVSRRTLRATRQAQQQQAIQEATLSQQISGEQSAIIHPAHENLVRLNKVPQRRRQAIMRENWEMVKDFVNAMPTASDGEKARRASAEDVLTHVDYLTPLIYKQGQKTPRFYAVGRSVTQFPREVRKVAFRGCTEVDLRACQLAIVAEKWRVENLLAFLKNDGDIWQELREYLDVSPEFKPILKSTLYSLIFGMPTPGLKAKLANGTKRAPGVGFSKSRLFFKHRFITALLESRQLQLKRISRNRGARDAFGFWWETYAPSQMRGRGTTQRINHQRRGRRKRRKAANRSVLAAVVQSYEVKIMSSILSVVEKEKQVYLFCWLHDGVVLFFGDKDKKERQIKRIAKTLREAALTLDIHIEVEIKEL